MSTSLTIIQGIISKDEDRYSRRPRCFARCYRQCPRYDTEDATRSNDYDTGLTYPNLGYMPPWSPLLSTHHSLLEIKILGH
jgi:hypothetical protein